MHSGPDWAGAHPVLGFLCLFWTGLAVWWALVVQGMMGLDLLAPGHLRINTTEFSLA